MILIAIAACVFIGVAFAALGFVMEAQSKTMSTRFTHVASKVIDDEYPESLKGSLKERILDPILQRLNEVAERLTPAGSAKAVAMQLERAGRPWGMTPQLWALVRMGCAFGGVMLSLFAMKLVPLDGMLKLCVAMIPAAAAIIGPSAMLDKKCKARQAVVRRTLPDLIDLLVVSVEAGLGLDAAVQEVIDRREGPLLDELARVLAEIRVGKSRRQAWQEMAARLDVLELKVFVAALVQAEELGASVAGVLRGQSDAIRMRRSLAIREMAAVLPVKMLFPLIFFIFPGMFVVILGPGAISMLTTFKDIGF